MAGLQLAPYGQSVVSPRAQALEAQAMRNAPIRSPLELGGRLALYARARALENQANQAAQAQRGEFSARLQALSGAMASGDPVARTAARSQALELASAGIGSDDPLIRNFALTMLQRPIDELLDVQAPTTQVQQFGPNNTGIRAVTTDGQGGIGVRTVQEPSADPKMTSATIMRAEQLDPSLAGTPEGRRMVEVQKRPDGSIASVDFASQGTKITNNVGGSALGKTDVGKAQLALEAALDAYGPDHPVVKALQAEISAAAAPTGEAEAAKNERKVGARRKQLQREAGAEVQRLQSFLEGVGAGGVVTPAVRARYQAIADAAANAIAKARGTPGAEPGIPQLQEARDSLPTLGDVTASAMGGGDIAGAKFGALGEEFGLAPPAAAGADGLQGLDEGTRQAIEQALPPGSRVKSVRILP